MVKNSVFGYHPHPYQMSPNNSSLFHSNTESVCEIPHLVEKSTFMSPLRPSMYNCEATKDEMHEDIEELNALLSSDEETSTGNSPSAVIDKRSLEPVVEVGEQVVSFAGRASTKRWRIQHNPTALADDDAESVYVGSDKHCRKRFRRDKIHETLEALRCLIPGAEGKNTVVVIDEAVDYLRSLKVKSKALGL